MTRRAKELANIRGNLKRWSSENTPEKVMSKLLGRALVSSYEIRQSVNRGAQPPKAQVQRLVNDLILITENAFGQVDANRGWNQAVVFGETVASALGTITAAGWRRQKIGREDARVLSDEIRWATEVWESRNG